MGGHVAPNLHLRRTLSPEPVCDIANSARFCACGMDNNPTAGINRTGLQALLTSNLLNDDSVAADWTCLCVGVPLGREPRCSWERCWYSTTTAACTHSTGPSSAQWAAQRHSAVDRVVHA